MNILFLMAQQPAADGQAGNPILNFLPIIVIFAVFYFFMIRPQQKKQKQMQEMIDNLQRGDQVITTGGLVGQIIGRKDDIVVLKSGETKFEVNKAYITEKIVEKDRFGSK